MPAPLPSCFARLERLDLNDNYLREVPVAWTSQMHNLKILHLSRNGLQSITPQMFSNISNIDFIDLSGNLLTSVELWLLQIKKLIDYSSNPITRFTNYHNYSLANYRSSITQQIVIYNTRKLLDFDDGVLEMYNRCEETDETYPQIIMEAVKKIHDTNPGLLNWNCSCKFYHLRKYLMAKGNHSTFAYWACPNESDLSYDEKCNCQSSFASGSNTPSFCKIHDWTANKNCGAVSKRKLSSQAMRIFFVKIQNRNVNSFHSRTVWKIALIYKHFLPQCTAKYGLR